MRKILDKVITLRPEPGPKAAGGSSVRPAFCLRLMATTAITAVITFLNITTANAYPLKRYQQDWALVAMNHLRTLDETQCWVSLIWRESRFDPQARNGSHYGLAQMRSTWYKDLKPRQQVKAHMNYLDHRYDGSACKALKHLITKGWH